MENNNNNKIASAIIVGILGSGFVYYITME